MLTLNFCYIYGSKHF